MPNWSASIRGSDRRVVTAPDVDLRILGPVHLLVDGHPLAVGGPKVRALLAVLAMQPGRAVSAGTIADAVWDGEPPADEVGSLQVLVFNLRKKLRATGLDAPAVLRTVAPGYSLELPSGSIDRTRFDRLRRDAVAEVRGGNHERAAEIFRDALAQWSGDALADLRGLRFADEAAAALDEERGQTLIARIEADIACGRAANIVGELVALTSEQPLNEPLWAQLVTALYLVGRQADALAACARLRSVLADELGIEPSRRLADLELAVLRGEPVAPTGPLVAVGSAPAPPAAESGSIAAFSTTVVDGVSGPRRGRLLVDDGRTLTIGDDRVRIGRMPDNELMLDDPRASRYHAEIFVGRFGVTLQDLDSTNGTLLNDNPVRARAFLTDGDVISIGDVDMRFEAS